MRSVERMKLEGFLVAASLTAACTSTGASSAPDAARTDDSPVPVGLSTCSVSGTQFQFVHSGGLFEEASTQALIWRGGASGNVLGVEERQHDWHGWFQRIGDPDAATLGTTGSYDVAAPAYHIQFAECDNTVTEQDCLGGTSALGGVYFSSYAGTLVVDRVSPVFEARFTLGALKQGRPGDGGTGIEGVIDGCIAVPN